METKKGIFVSCEEANHLCDKGQYRESSFWEKVKLNMHILYCKVCRKYSMNNGKLTKLVTDPKVVSITRMDKEEMKARLQQKMSEK